MPSLARRTIHYFAPSFRHPYSTHRSRWADYLSLEDSPIPALPVARPQTMLFAPWLAAGKDETARSKPASGGIRPLVALAQLSQFHFGRPARLVGVCRASSPILVFPARCSVIPPDVCASFPELWRVGKDFALLRTDYRQNSAKYSLADEADRE